MKTLKFIPFFTILFFFAQIGFSQSLTSEKMKVSGECGMCKKKIEKAAMDAGAFYAVWTSDSKVLELKYNSDSTNTDKIQQKIAEVGYDTPKFRATDEAYEKLSPCCHYEREAVSSDAKTASMKCEMKDGKCVDSSSCKGMGGHSGDATCKDMGSKTGDAKCKDMASKTGGTTCKDMGSHTSDAKCKDMASKTGDAKCKDMASKSGDAKCKDMASKSGDVKCKDMGSHTGGATCNDGNHAKHDEAMNCSEGNNKGKSAKSCCEKKKTE